MAMNDPQRAHSVDWERVDRWTAELLADDVSAVTAAFVNAYGTALTIIWNPRPDDLDQEKLRFLLNYWTGLYENGQLPQAGRIDPVGMRQALGYVMLVDPIDAGRDFRYRLFGSELAAVTGADLTGQLASTGGWASGLVVDLGLATLRAAFVRKHPIYTVRTPRAAQYTAEWHRLALPLIDGSGAVIRFLCGSVPLSPEGRSVAQGFRSSV
jgi:hypothetical protein